MKKRISFLVAMLMLVHIGLLSSCRKTRTDVDETKFSTTEKSEYAALGTQDGKDIVAKNERYTLLYDPETTAIALQDMQSGATFGSTPNEAEYASVSRVENITNQIKSSLILYYYDGTEQKTLFSFPDSVTKNQTRVFSIENGVRVEYIIGEPQSFEVFPNVLTAEYVENELLTNFSEEAKRYFLRYYQKRVYNELEEGERNEYLQSYPKFAQHDFYERYSIDRIPVKFRKLIQSAFMENGLTMEVMTH